MSEKIGALIKTSLVDYPGKLCATVFLKNCNLRCPYCYNGSLVTDSADEKELSTLEEIQNHLLKRKNVLEAFTISGGEALLSPYTVQLLTFAKKEGYKTKLDTNGTLPSLLEKIVNNCEAKPDFIAMDIKTSPQNYQKLLNAQECNKTTDYKKLLLSSIKTISTYPSDLREFRTVLVPTLVKKDDIEQIAKILPEDAVWQFARFIPGNCLEKLYNFLPPYTEEECVELVNFAKKFIKNSFLR